MKETRFIITRRKGDRVQFLAHQGHAHLWTNDRYLAMEYTKKFVAEELATKNDGTVQEL